MLQLRPGTAKNQYLLKKKKKYGHNSFVVEVGGGK